MSGDELAPRYTLTVSVTCYSDAGIIKEHLQAGIMVAFSWLWIKAPGEQGIKYGKLGLCEVLECSDNMLILIHWKESTCGLLFNDANLMKKIEKDIRLCSWGWWYRKFHPRDLRIQELPCLVLTVSCESQQAEHLVIRCTTVAGSQLALVEVEAQQTVASLRNMIRRASGTFRPMRLVRCDGALLDADTDVAIGDCLL